MAYWVGLKEERTMGAPYLGSFDHWAGHTDLGPERLSFVANQLAHFLAVAALHHEAEPLMRRALTIAERSSGTEHPYVAIRLNNLAQLLQATNRLAEAKPLMRRVVTILLKVGQTPDLHYPHLPAAINYYAGLLEAMGHSPQEVLATVNAIAQPYGISSGKQA
ncbi:MAG: tetratricopeptide repeat protein [Nitrospira sp.]|nr:tetratricopeptide repeat protein [Nitrospira sp.]